MMNDEEEEFRMRNLWKITISLVFAAALAVSARADTSATILVDWRGLPQVQGILRDGDKVDWGFVNFVAFGPGWSQVVPYAYT